MAETESKSSVETVGPLKRRLDIEISAVSVTASLEKAWGRLQRRVRLRGFRAGKAPRPVLERLYGQQVRTEVIEGLVRDAYADALVRHHVMAVTQPDIVVEPLGEPAVLRFSATVDVRPEVLVSNIEGIEVARPGVTIGDADVDRVLGRLAEAAARLEPVTDRDRVEAGDVVTADIAAEVDGGVVAELAHTDVLLEAGAGSFPGALEERLVGLASGTVNQVQVSYPADYANPTVAGKTVAFRVEVKAIGRKHVPSLDDEFARSQGQHYVTLDDLRGAVRERLVRDADQRADAAVRDAVVDVLIARHPIDAPDAMVERRCAAMLETLDVRLPEGRDRQKALATLRQELRPRALRDVKAAILLDALTEQQGVKVSDDEIAQRIERIADAAKQTHARVRALYADPDRRRTLHMQMLREKALSLLVDRAKIQTLERA